MAQVSPFGLFTPTEVSVAVVMYKMAGVLTKIVPGPTNDICFLTSSKDQKDFQGRKYKEGQHLHTPRYLDSVQYQMDKRGAFIDHGEYDPSSHLNQGNKAVVECDTDLDPEEDLMSFGGEADDWDSFADGGAENYHNDW